MSKKSCKKNRFRNLFTCEKELSVDNSQNNRLDATLRKAHLEETARSQGLFLYSLSDIYEIRWIAADQQSFTKLLKNWPILVMSLRTVCDSEDEFAEGICEKAEWLVGRLLNRNILVNLHFHADVITELSILSQQVQRRSGLLFDKIDQLDRVMDVMENLKGDDRRDGFFKVFKSQLSCWNDDDGVGEVTVAMGCSEDEIYASDHVTWRGIELGPKDLEDGVPRLNNLKVPTLQTNREYTLQLLKDKLTWYSQDRDILHAFNVLEPSKFPKDPQEMRSYGIGQITKVAEVLAKHRDYQEELEVEWRILMRNFLAHPGFEEDTKLDAATFWQSYLGKDSAEFEFPPKVRFVVHSSLSLPASTADPERSFTVMKSIRPQSRNRLCAERIDALMRIRLNGPPIEKFDAMAYSEEWVRRGYLLVDDSRTFGERGYCNLDPNRDKAKTMSGKSNLF